MTYDADKEITFSSYACKCIHNEILALIRTQKRHPTVSLDAPLSLDDETITFMDLIESPDPLPEDICAQLTPDDIIDICMRANVHPGDINAMELRLQGHNHTEVGRILGMSQPGATRRIQRAARCIKERLFT
ncbi:hypothetical protein AGMMS49992_24170 [Clostridia bacterium]|nr:hypothetical protein AGMMS49992_24170 [Clostridia bacterium]